MPFIVYVIMVPIAYISTKEHDLIDFPLYTTIKTILLIVFLVVGELYLSFSNRIFFSNTYIAIKLFELFVLIFFINQYARKYLPHPWTISNRRKNG